MRTIDWRELYASNRAAIEAAGVAPGTLPAAVPMTSRGPTVPKASPLPKAWPPARVTAGGASAGMRTFAVAGGTRRALVHVPVGQDREEPLPLLCMLHGCTQDPASFAAATRMNDAAERHGFVVVYPEQQRGANPQGCWNWFLPEHQHRGAGEPAALAGIVEQVIAASDQAIDARRVFVAGLSSGGAMAAIFAATYPDVVAAAAVHSGLAYGSASNVSAAFQTMARGGATAAEQGPAARRAMGPHARAVPTMVIHGRADQTVAPVNADQVLQQAMTANRLATAGAWDIDPGRPTTTAREHRDGGLAWTRSRWTDGAGRLLHELILVDGLGHAWSGGPAGGSYTDPRGPDATEAILRFFAAATSATAR